MKENLETEISSCNKITVPLKSKLPPLVTFLSLASWDESLLSRDESLISQEPVKRIFWNKLQAVSLGENN